MLAEYAILSKETYSIEHKKLEGYQLPEDWEVYSTKINPVGWQNCFVVFKNDTKKEIVISVRGTENIFNILTDIGLTVSRITDESFLPTGQKELERLVWNTLRYRPVKKDGYKLKLVGHSLGAVMAELAAVKYGVECISFESPGSLNIMEKYPDTYLEENFHVVTNYLSAPNVINTLNKHVGRIYRMHLRHTNQRFNGWHALECALSSAFTGANYLILAWPAAYYYEKISLDTLRILSKETFCGAIIAKLGSRIVNNRDDFQWLLNQHSIVNITNFLLSDHKYVSKMQSWPTIWEVLQDRKLVACFRNILPLPEDRLDVKSFLTSMMKELIPLQKDCPGIRNIFDENGMREAAVRFMPGYQEELGDKSKCRWFGYHSNRIDPDDIDVPMLEQNLTLNTLPEIKQEPDLEETVEAVKFKMS